jgi:hypothetical protein
VVECARAKEYIEMFINYDLIRQQAQGYNVNLDAFYMPVQQGTGRNIAQQLADTLRSVLGGDKFNARRAKAKPAFMGHAAGVAK